MKTKLTHSSVNQFAKRIADQLHCIQPPARSLRVYAIPRGGIPAALAVGQHIRIQLVDDPQLAQVFIDDIVDSGSTRARYTDEFPSIPFFALIDKTTPTDHDRGLGWVVFPWEGDAEGSFEDNVTRLLQFVGEDPTREGLKETPNRVAKAWQFWCSGYNKDPAHVLKVFSDGAERHDQMVTVENIPIYSHCEHHLAPIFGTCTISYIPNGNIVGLSKLPRLVEIFARRLQVQERITDQIADALDQNLKPLGVGVVIKARHLCMESRGICQQGHQTITTALRGVIKSDSNARAEFMRFV